MSAVLRMIFALERELATVEAERDRLAKALRIADGYAEEALKQLELCPSGPKFWGVGLSITATALSCARIKMDTIRRQARVAIPDLLLMPMHCDCCGGHFRGNGVGCECPNCGSFETDEDE